MPLTHLPAGVWERSCAFPFVAADLVHRTLGEAHDVKRVKADLGVRDALADRLLVTGSRTRRSRPSTCTPGSPGPADPASSRSSSSPAPSAATTKILNANRLELNNGRLEGLNSRIRLISHRSFGFHSASPLIALVYLCCTGIVIPLPR